MATNTRAGNTIRIETSAAFADVQCIKGIKFHPIADGSASIKKESNSGNILWEHASGDGDPSPLEPVFEAVNIRTPKGIYVTVSAGSTVTIYI
jgi:hypothetical protein